MKLCYGIRNSEGDAIHKNGNKVEVWTLYAKNMGQ